jgi:hypothetical protein
VRGPARLMDYLFQCCQAMLYTVTRDGDRRVSRQIAIEDQGALPSLPRWVIPLAVTWSDESRLSDGLFG